MEVVEISKEIKEQITGKYYTDNIKFSPVINSTGVWCLSLDVVNNITNPDFEYLKTFPTTDFERIDSAKDLADVFNSDNLDQSDADFVVRLLSDANSLIERTIRFRGVKPSSDSYEQKKTLMDQGIIILKSKL